MSDITKKIGKLLLAAEGASTQEEADAFFSKAQSLATTHSISTAVARQKAVSGEIREEPTHSTITVGLKRQHKNSNLIRLYMAVAEPQGVRINIASDNTYLIAFGMPSDIELVSQLWASVAVQMATASDRYLRTDVWRSQTMEQKVVVHGGWSTRTEWTERPMTKQAARKSFQSGYISAVAERLRVAARKVEEAAVQADHFHRDEAHTTVAAGDTGVALAIRKKSEDVVAYYQKTSNARGSWRGAGGRSNAAISGAGGAAGAKARLSASQGVGGGGRALAAA